MLLFIDNFDSFTFMLADYFKQLDFDLIIKRNNEITIEEISSIMPQAIVLGPGPDVPSQSGVMMNLIKQFHSSIPMLGICLGHQAIGEFFGATLIKAEKPLHGKTSAIYHHNHFLFQNLPSPFNAMRYHSLILKDLEKTDLEIICQTNEKEIMGIAHKTLPLYGLQFHPESVLTENGLQILKNWKESLN